jgi:hypothetical protein
LSLANKLNIFAFDMLVQNADRSHHPDHGKPNLLYDGQKVWIFDHELAFSSTALIGTLLQTPWQLRGQVWVEHHLFCRDLRQTDATESAFDDFLDRFGAVSDDFLHGWVHAIPASWRDDTITGRIINHLKDVRNNIDLFKRGLLKAVT